MTVEQPKSPQGKQIKEWEAGFRGFQRSTAPVEKTDIGYGGAEESAALSRPFVPSSLPFLGEEHKHQAQSRARAKKRIATVERTRKELEEKPMETSKAMKTKAGKTLHFKQLEEKIKESGGADDPAKVAGMVYHRAGGKPGKKPGKKTKKAQKILKRMLKAAVTGRAHRPHPHHAARSYLSLPRSTGKRGGLKKMSSKDREESRKMALAKLTRVAEQLGTTKKARALPVGPGVPGFAQGEPIKTRGGGELWLQGPAKKPEEKEEEPKLHLEAPKNKSMMVDKMISSCKAIPEPMPAMKAAKESKASVGGFSGGYGMGHMEGSEISKPVAETHGETSKYHEAAAKKYQEAAVKKFHKGCEPVKKDFEHLAGKFRSDAETSPTMKPTHVAQTASSLGWEKPASVQAPAAKQQALSGHRQQGATGAVGGEPSHILTSAPQVPPPVPAAAGGSLKPGSTISMHSVAKPGSEKAIKGMTMTKSAILDLMMMKAQTAEQSPANPANEPGPVSGFGHAGKARARTSVPADADEQFPGNPSNIQGSVSGSAHAGKGPAQTSVGGSVHVGRKPARTSVPYDGEEQFPGNPSQMNKAQEEEHAGKGPAETSVSGEAHAGKGSKKRKVEGTVSAGREENVNKAVTSMAVPRMPRAMAMAMDTWRSGTNVLTRGNSAMHKHFQHHGAGPLFPETAEAIEEESQERATRRPQEILKSCGACGRTYRVFKSMDEPCPTCSQNERSCMAKSRGGELISSFIKD